jgi:hypothetical protein
LDNSGFVVLLLLFLKRLLGQVRGKFGGQVPIPGDNVTLNAADLLSQAQAEQASLREELNKQLDEMLYAKLVRLIKVWLITQMQLSDRLR